MCFAVCCSQISLGRPQIFLTHSHHPYEQIFKIEKDEFVPDHMLFSTSSSMWTVDVGGNQHSIIGSTSFGYSEGTGGGAQFKWITGFTQIENGRKVLVAEYFNHCIRSVNRLTNSSSIYSGNCTNEGYRDGGRKEALFTYPWDIITSSDERRAYITERYYAVRVIDLVTETVSTLIEENDLVILNYMIHSPIYTNRLMISFHHGIADMDLTSGTVSTISGVKIYSGYRTGSFSQARFNNPSALLSLPSINSVLVADEANYAIRLLNFSSNTVSTPIVLDFEPQSLCLWSDHLYVGGAGKIYKLSCTCKFTNLHQQ